MLLREETAEREAAVQKTRTSWIIGGLVIVSLSGFCIFFVISFRNTKSYAKYIKKSHQELKFAQDQLVKSEKMASLGVLTLGISHEINNPLNFIKNGVLAMSMHIEGKNGIGKELEPYMEIINEGVNRSTRIINSLSHISKAGSQMNEVCNVHEILDNCLVILDSTISKEIEISKHYAQTPLILNGNEGKLHQAMMNILSNAIQAMEDGGGKLTISTEISKAGAIITISDTGIGIPTENLKRIGNPFFATKASGKGTGLGLFITYSIIDDHDGQVEINSDIDKETKFILKFPI